MPILVIHELEKAPKQISFTTSPLRIGRDPDCCDLVLPSASVSREHAELVEVTGTWFVRCHSPGNPIMVNGYLVREGSLLGEGAEIMVGAEHLLIFCQDEYQASTAMGLKSFFSRNVCNACQWSGMICTLRRKPVCPRCGSSELVAEHAYQPEEARRAATGVEATVSAPPEQMRKMLHKIRTAKKSRIERLDAVEDSRQVELSEAQPVRLAKDRQADLKLVGLIWGQGIRITWDGLGYSAFSLQTWPAMRVNDKKGREARLQNGDVIKVGRNLFRFVTG